MLRNSCRQTEQVQYLNCHYSVLVAWVFGLSVDWGFLSKAMFSECSVLAAVSCVAVSIFFFLIFNTKFWAYYLSALLLLYREQATIALVCVPLTAFAYCWVKYSHLFPFLLVLLLNCGNITFS